MRKKWINIGKKIAILGMVFSLTSPMVYASSTKDKLDDVQQDKKDTEERLEQVEQKIEELEQLKSDAQEYIKAMDAELAIATDNLEDLENQKVQKEAEIKQTEEELVVAKEVEAEQLASMQVRIQFMYENGNESYLDMIFNSKSIAELLNKAEYVSQIMAYDRQMLEEYQETRAIIEEKEERLTREYQELEVLVAQAEEEKEAIELLISSKAKQLAQYESDIEASEAEVASMQEEMDALDREIAKLEQKIREEEEAARRAAQQQKVVYDGGKFLFPLNSYSRMTSDYGWRIHPIYGTQRLHNGMDFGASTGTPIMAAYDGEGVVSTYSSSAGNYIMINHGGGLSTVYMHCSKLIAKVGDTVKKGDVIGLVGSTGNSTGPHLHFSVRVNGEYVDPAPYIGYSR